MTDEPLTTATWSASTDLGDEVATIPAEGPSGRASPGGASGGRRAARRGAERRRRRRRNLAVLAVLCVLALPLLAAGIWFYFQIEPMGDPGAQVHLTVRSGWGTGEVGDALAAKHVIGSPLAFKVWATLKGSTSFHAGAYTFRKNMGVRDALNVLEAGPPPEPDLKLLIPPGLTLGQIAERVAQLPGHTRDTFLQVVNSGAIRSKYEPANVTSLEGLLFPDTYFIGAHEADASIVRRLIARFDEIADRVGLANAPTTNGLTPYQTVVAASLVQTEAKLAEDQPLIAAVIVNRLRDNMPLQIDSTLCYAKGGCPPVPTNADKAIDSPYNTYKVTGLPPTPIAAVSEASLRAALNPATVPYKYYVIADANGKHAFATTLQEHERNVAAARAKGLI